MRKIVLAAAAAGAVLALGACSNTKEGAEADASAAVAEVSEAAGDLAAAGSDAAADVKAAGSEAAETVKEGADKAKGAIEGAVEGAKEGAK